MKSGQYIVLGLYEVHMASAAIMVDGEVLAGTHEERFSKVKNDSGFPLNAALYCLQSTGIKPEEVDAVAFVNSKFHSETVANILFKRMALFDNSDWIEENEKFWHPRLVEGRNPGPYFDIMGGWDRVTDGHHYALDKLDMSADEQVIQQTFNDLRREAVVRLLGIPGDRVRFMPHYMCHHHHAYYSGYLRGSDVVVMHAEGSGEDYNQAVSRPTPDGLKIIAGTNRCDLGRLYQWITLHLGMKPYAHEYKLMGLAPHASDHEIRKSLKVFDPIFKTDRDRLVIEYNEKPSDLYYHFRDALHGHRFDGIAGALQQVVEDRLVEWLDAVIQKTGCRRIAYGGGVAMNVKANKRLWEHKDVDDFYVPLSPADESNVFGAAYRLTEEHFLRTDQNPDDIPPLKTPYLGPDYTVADEKAATEAATSKGYTVRDNADDAFAAKLLAEGQVVARCQGRSEFGQRALGNRSILANPSKRGTVEKINRQIKYRDFWMPFAPSILDSAADQYLKNPKNLNAPYMTMAFASREEKASEIIEALHQSDLSARPQIVSGENNPGYHRLISKFQKITGIGALLNTSFNLHGEPIVTTPLDALHVFENSELDVVWFGDHMIMRQP